MYSEDSVSEITSDLSHVIGLPETELIHRGLISFMEKEIRLAEADIADLVDRYNVASKEDLYEAIRSKKIPSHPAWEDYIIWKNKEKYIKDLKAHLGKVQ
ncbi:MAG: hypothetical protein O8C66_02305 [Candidatus Methanoperedens sp.]|nr:hypothetical protein [Candidatus Methanoperedens sp.]MCZ7369319.1 hypothetical protein [Candidatus Methanoperedens sp.]